DAEPEAPAAPPMPEPACHELIAERPPRAWADAVADAAGRIRDGRLEKVVLARELEIRTDVPIDRGVVLDRLARAFPSSMVYGVGGFVGASPELLVGRTGDVVRAQPMAGTTPRTGDPTRDVQLAAALLASAKDRQEHQFTIDAVHDGLLPWCSYLDAGTEPEVFSVANVQHLASTVEGRLSHPPASILQLVAGLHPTPAVGGQPTDEATTLLRAIEGRDRGPYAGPVGWVDGAGNGRFAVGIRGAELAETTARVLSGVGVVADSDPEAELAETRAKLRAILGALVSP
ncbi:MAG: isochorismate synthase, partial [Actinomycetota bacterium]